MPAIKVVFFQDDDGSVPALTALDYYEEHDQKVAIKLQALIEALSEHGYGLRRPMTDALRNGIYELRGKVRGVNHRLLYFYGGNKIAVLSHHLTKEKKVPDKDIDLAVRRKNKFLNNPDKYTFNDT
jgi:phage-related protein